MTYHHVRNAYIVRMSLLETADVGQLNIEDTDVNGKILRHYNAGV